MVYKGKDTAAAVFSLFFFSYFGLEKQKVSVVVQDDEWRSLFFLFFSLVDWKSFVCRSVCNENDKKLFGYSSPNWYVTIFPLSLSWLAHLNVYIWWWKSFSAAAGLLFVKITKTFVQKLLGAFFSACPINKIVQSFNKFLIQKCLCFLLCLVFID